MCLCGLCSEEMATHDAFLRAALAKYRYHEETKKEVMKIIDSFNDLRPTTNNYVHNNGASEELVCLDGTIPVTYKGKVYNIPICIYLVLTHPYNPPIIYVKPTTSMNIRPGKHVDASGRVYLPYLHEWRHPKSDLSGVIQIMAIVFGEEPPVFAKHTTTVMPPPRPPYPINAGIPTQASNRPPYPINNQPFPQPQYPPTSSGYSQNNPQGPFGGNVSEEERRLSLLSAVEDKMKKRLKDIFAQGQAEMESLKTTQEDLEKGRQKLEDMMAKIEREQSKLESDMRLLQARDEEISKTLSKMKLSEEVDLDDIINPTAPLYKQILTAYAEEQSIDDAIYYLGEALRKEVIELDVFLKQIRELSRKQFLLRMLINKCRHKAGLSEIY